MPVIPARALRVVLMAANALIGFALAMLGLQIPLVFFVVAAGIVWRKASQATGTAWTHGSAITSGFAHLIRNNLLGKDGLILGTDFIVTRPTLREGLSALWSRSRTPDLACYLFLLACGGRKWCKSRMIRLTHFTHLATFAPTGRGKSIYVLMLNLLSYRQSCVVIDPKGELLAATGWHRHNILHNEVYLLDPFDICGYGSNKLNPLDFIDDNAPDFLDQCRDLANMLILRSGTEKDPHWNDSAELILTSFIVYVCACETDPNERNLKGVRALLASRDSYNRAIDVMRQIDSHGGVIQNLGEELRWFIDRELSSVMTTLHRQTQWMDTPLVALNISTTSTFDPMALRRSPTTVYLCLPHDKLETLAPLMRMWIGVILRTITRGKPSERNPVLFLLDEAAHIGKINVLENAVTLMRGMGIRLWFFFQSLNQVQECYGEKAKTILDNIDTQQFFGTTSYEVAEELSKRIGDTTISVASRGRNSGWSRNTGGTGPSSGSESGGENINVSDTGRRIYKPEEILVASEQVAFVFHRNMPVIVSWLVAYFDHPAFRNDGTGQQTALDRTASGMSVALLLASLLFAGATLMFPPFDSQPARHAHSRPVVRPAEAYRRSRPYLPADSGRQDSP